MNVKRVVLLFAYCFGCIILPVAVILPLYFLTAAEPYLVDEDAAAFQSGAFLEPSGLLGEEGRLLPQGQAIDVPGALAPLQAEFPDHTRVGLFRLPGPDEAGKAKSALLDQIPRNSTTYQPGQAGYTRSDGRGAGLVVAAGAFVIWVEGPDGDAVRARFGGLPFIRENPEKSLIGRVVLDHTGWFLAAILIYCLAQVFIWPRLASWAAQASPRPGAAPASAHELKARLLSLGSPDAPFQVEEGRAPGEIIVTWKYVDAHWAGLMAAGGVRSLARIRLRLDEAARTARAQDSLAGVTWDAAGIGAGSGLKAEVSWRAFKGIIFAQYDRGLVHGLIIKDGRPTFDRAYNYTFSFGELKNPVIDLVREAGWTYRPVITFIRMFN